MPTRLLRRAALLSAILLILCAGAASAGAPAAAGAQEIYSRYRGRVLRIRILEKSSRSQATVGSGFVVGTGGLAVTNYHVVNQLVWFPEDYEAVAVLDNGETRKLTLVDLDVVHDLAVVSLEGGSLGALTIAGTEPPKGRRLYAMGNPHDLGMTIVEGSYSGLLAEMLIPKVHFTGSVNPGMSGGPVLDDAGEVVGVSVATSGDQVSFLVPSRFLKPLLDRGGKAKPGEFKGIIAEQLRAHQEDAFASLFAHAVSTQALGSFQVPGQLSPVFHCWANTNEAKEQPYTVIHSECEIKDEIFINDRLSTGAIGFTHHGLVTSRLNPFQFAALQQHYLTTGSENGASILFSGFGRGSEEEEVTPYECESSLVKNGELILKGVLCLRAHKEFKGLYDLHWKAGSLAASRQGFVTALNLEGVTRENAARFLTHYIEAFAWKR